MTPNQKEQFEAWWQREGRFFPNECMEIVGFQKMYKKTKEKCEDSWLNGAYKNSARQKIKSAVGIVGISEVWDRLWMYVSWCGSCSVSASSLIIETDGSIYNEETGRYLTENELEEFVSWAERENA